MRNSMFLGLAVALLTASVAFADGPAGQAGVVTTTDVKGHALHLTISGGIDIDGVWRDDNLVAVLEREGPRSNDNSDGDSFFSPRVWLRFDAYMSDHVSAVIELNNERLQSDLGSNFQDNDPSAGGGWGAAANSTVFGGGYASNNDISISLQQAYIQVDDFLMEHFSMRFGIQDFVVDLRGNGNPFLIGFRPDGAGKAFISPIQESFSSDGSRYAYGDISGASDRGVYRSEEEPGGLRVTYSADECFHLDAWVYDIWETGFQHRDEWFWGVMGKYNIPDSPSVVQFIFDSVSNDSGANAVYTIGPGVDYWWDNLELYGEYYYQWGDYGYDGAILNSSEVNDGQIDQRAQAFYFGARYNFEASCAPWVDVQYAYVDGSDGDHNDDGDTNKNFVSYEDNDSLMILEDNLYGLDVQSNYWKAQLNAGLVMCLQHEKDLTASLTYAYAECITAPDRLDLSSDFSNSLEVKKDLGHEIDVKLVWQYSDSLSFDIGTAWLFNGDFWASEQGIDSDPNRSVGNNMYLISVGATVKF